MSRLRDLVADNQKAHFVFFRDKCLFYETDQGFLFPVPVDDAGSATFNSEEKAMLLMRYIGKHLADVELARQLQDDGL